MGGNMEESINKIQKNILNMQHKIDNAKGYEFEDIKEDLDSIYFELENLEIN
jgi:hypothetical protein